MPVLGDTTRAKELGLASGKYIWRACGKCGKEQWIRLARNIPLSLICKSCQVKQAQPCATAASKKTNWKGGRIKSDGYMTVFIEPSDFFYPMRFQCKPYVLEHRLVMAKFLGRCLQPWEIVHHRNGDRLDNRIENLEVGGSNGEHIREHNKGYRDGFKKGYFEGKNKRIRELEKRIHELEAK